MNTFSGVSLYVLSVGNSDLSFILGRYKQACCMWRGHIPNPSRLQLPPCSLPKQTQHRRLDLLPQQNSKSHRRINVRESPTTLLHQGPRGHVIHNTEYVHRVLQQSIGEVHTEPVLHCWELDSYAWCDAWHSKDPRECAAPSIRWLRASRCWRLITAGIRISFSFWYGY